MNKIAIRADGGSKIGMGHIMRTLVLAKELAKTNEVFYICSVDDPLTDQYKCGIEKIKSEGFNVEYVSENSVIEGLKRISADCLITDSYDVDESYFNEVKKIFRRTGYIDDMNLYYFNVDFIINQNINANELRYTTNEYTKLFLGSRYVMLRDEFRTTPKKIIKENVENVLITLGGSDNNHVTEKVLNYTKDLNYNFYVVIGPSFIKLDELKEIEKENKNVKLCFNANMFELMEKCDIAISGCGSTLYELAACGVPALGIILAANQKDIANFMEKSKLIINLGDYRSLSKNKLSLEISNMCFSKRLFIYNKQRDWINRSGVEDLSMELNKLLINKC